MEIQIVPKAFLSNEAKELLNLYELLGDRAEIFLPRHIFDNLKNFVNLCTEEPNDPARQQAQIHQYLLKFREDLPGYWHVLLMLTPHDNSKAFELSNLRGQFVRKINHYLDTDGASYETCKLLTNIRDTRDFSVGTPPINSRHIEFMSQLQLGGAVRDLRKYRDVIGVTGDIAEAHWNYLMDILEQMISQSTHYTTKAEVNDFLHRSNWAVNFKGMNGLIRTVVSGNSDKAVAMLKGEVFNKSSVVVMSNPAPQELYDCMTENTTSIFVVKVNNARVNHYSGEKWFPLITRLVIVDDSKESRISNTSLVFCFHNGIINTLNKVHTKKFGALANTQLNFRLILENVNKQYIEEFRIKIDEQIEEYTRELNELISEQTGEQNDPIRRIMLLKLDSFSKQIVQDKCSLEKLRDFIFFLENSHNSDTKQIRTQELIDVFENHMKHYFYGGNSLIDIATILEGGGRNQIKIFGDFLRNKPFKPVNDKIKHACSLILDVIPNCYERTLHNHFHKNFGINLFLERYKEYVAKISRESDNKGRFERFLTDLGVIDKYSELSDADRDIVRNFLSALGNTDQTSVPDDVQMIIRDLVFNYDGRPKPYIIYNAVQAWEYKDLYPEEDFNLNPFDIEIENHSNGRLHYERLTEKLLRIKSKLALFDDTGALWDLFCENTTIIINDPNNPTGYSDYNSDSINDFLKFMNSSKITLFLDEAYTESVHIKDENMPKWRSISRYIMNNINAQSRIRAVSSLSTTKNLAATGERLGAIAVTPEAADFATFARGLNETGTGNNNSLLMLNNILATARTAKDIKDCLEAELPKNASRSKIKKAITDFIIKQIEKVKQENIRSSIEMQLHTCVGFEGTPIYLFLLDELVSLDKLDVLGLPDDFKYNGEPFFIYYKAKLLKSLNSFRVNKNFRSESIQRMINARKEGLELIENMDATESIETIAADGSYLFNFRVKGDFSYNELYQFCSELARQRGIATVPYPTGLVRFSLGGYVEATTKGTQVFEAEIKDAFAIFIRYWLNFCALKNAPANKKVKTSVLLRQLYHTSNDKCFIKAVTADFEFSAQYNRIKTPSLQISDNRSLYHTSSEKSGITITTIGRSKNSVIELHGDLVGSCRDVREFICSSAFTKIYETLLAQVYNKIPALSELDFNTISSRYGKSVLLKYIINKKTFQPNHYVLDNPDDKNVMMEILIEMESLLFSDSKTKILVINATGDSELDKAKMEGINVVIKKYIKEILAHFNLPFEKESLEPSRREIIRVAGEYFESITGLKLEELNLNIWIDEFVRQLRKLPEFNSSLSQKTLGSIIDTIANGINESSSVEDKILYLYLLNKDNSFYKMVCNKLNYFNERINACDDSELKVFTEEFVTSIMPEQLSELSDYIMRKKDIKIAEDEIYSVSRMVVRFYISMVRRTKGTDYYNRYTHTIVRFVETAFKKQNSSVNEMVQHGISLYKNSATASNTNSNTKWISEMMNKCGVIASEQPVQEHTRIVTDAKKREYPFHKIDRTNEQRKPLINGKTTGDIDYVRNFYTRPSSSFFINRLSRFVATMDPDDYRCKVVKHGIVKELVVFQKGYMKYLTDNYRLNYTEDITLKDIRSFMPDVISLLGAPEKLLSFPQIGYFDVKSENGNIKTIITPLKSQADYFGNVKKPRLTIINEKVKELGGIPRHGSFFMVEENDGSLFGIEINGDSGVGKSEMIAAFILKWLRNNLEGIRSVKMIAGDMFHEFQDSKGNLYGIGTEVGDFSRTTDFDPDYIRYYKYLFETSADSNVEDLNSRSTVSGMCDISIPYRVDIMLSASNYAKEEAGITRIHNPENFLLYDDADGERKEKATSQDGPNFYCTLRRYTDDPEVVKVIAAHGNYLDDIFDWEMDSDGLYYLASSYKIIDKIDIVDTARKLFVGKEFPRNGVKYIIEDVTFDMIRNRFFAKSIYKLDGNAESCDIAIDRGVFGSLFDSLASTPGGQPFISEEGQYECIQNLVRCLRGGANGKGGAKNIECGIISTEIGRKGSEISGPQKAASALKQLIQEVRINRPEINEGKMLVKKLINEKYDFIFQGEMNSTELWRYNFYLYQLEAMRSADLRRMDDIRMKVDTSNLVGYSQGKAQKTGFNPLLVTPNLNIELTSFSETFRELMSMPNYPEFAEEFAKEINKLYIVEGYSNETNINNMIVQLLMLEGYINSDDIARGSVIEKVNRETIAAAKYAVVQFLENRNKPKKKSETKQNEEVKTK